MNILITLLDAIFDIWIWNLTWGWYQIILGSICMWILMICITKIKNIPALLLTFGSYIFSFILLSLFTIIIIWLELPLIEYDFPNTGNSIFFISLQLSILYTLLQTLFFYCMQKRYKATLLRIIYITIICHFISALFSAFLIKFSIIQP